MSRVRRVRAWDLAATEKSVRATDPDFSVGVLMAEREGVYYVCHVVRARVTAVMELMMQTALMDGKEVNIVFEQEPGAAGKLFSAVIIKRLAGWTVHAVLATGDKITRALPFLAQAQAGNVRLVRGEWNQAWLDEMTSMPNSAHDDQWDGSASAFSALASRGGWARGPAA